MQTVDLEGRFFKVCTVIVIPAVDDETLKASWLVDYFFSFNKEDNTLALTLLLWLLHNHAVKCNAVYYLNRQKMITGFSLKELPHGKEICINYAGEHGQEFKEFFKLEILNATVCC